MRSSKAPNLRNQLHQAPDSPTPVRRIVPRHAHALTPSSGRKLHQRAGFQPDEKEGLYAIEAMVQPIALRFKYHYDGKRDTNRLDKPEWYFTYVLNIAHEHHAFMTTVVQRLLSKSEYKHISAWVRLRLSFPVHSCLT